MKYKFKKKTISKDKQDKDEEAIYKENNDKDSPSESDIIYDFSNLEKIISMENELKPIDEFFKTHKSAYPFHSENAFNCLEKIMKIGKMQFHEIFLFWFPDYFSYYKSTMDMLLLSMNGYIPVTWKYYLGVMAASTMKSEFLFKHLQAEFLINGGNEDWMIYGLEAVPEKLRRLEKINNILAHQPWKLTENDILEIYFKTNGNLWNANELVEAVLILVNFHRLSIIIDSLKLSLTGHDSSVEELNLISFSEEIPDSKILKFINEEEVEKYKIINELENFNINISNTNNITSKKSESELLENKSSSKDKKNFFVDQSIHTEFYSKPNVTTIETGITKDYITSDAENSKLNKNSTHELYRLDNKNIDYNLKYNLGCFNSDSSNLNIHVSAETQKRKFSEDFSKHISHYCTVYLDFDSHSENYNSCLVKINSKNLK